MRTAIVVGSGPSGAAAAYGLIKAGLHVTMLDVGIEIEPGLRDLCANVGPVDTDAFLGRVRRQRSATGRTRSIPAKMPFGSDFAYRSIGATEVSVDARSRLVTSLALGGLSRTWGANVCHVAEHDVDSWPIRASDLDPHVATLGELVDVSGSAGDILDRRYSAVLASQSESFPLGPQGHWIMSRIGANVEALAARGLYCGRAKLAIGPRYASNGKGCVSCGLCMHGCPYNAIFSSADIVARLRREPGFRYLPGHLVRGFRENGEDVVVRCEELAGGATVQFRAGRLFLACGVIATTALVARSLGLVDHTFTIQDSTKYLFPFLTERRVRGALAHPANTLSQVFVQAVGLGITPRTVHGQLYGYNDLMLDPLRKLLGDSVFRLAPVAAFLLERVMIGMIYLHSDDSGVLKLKIHAEDRGTGLGDVQGEVRARSDAVMDEYLRTLTAARRELGGWPLRYLARRNPPGLSQHFGGTLPMRREPDQWSTDVFGRPWQCTRTHCVDSTILPSIPATPTALILMANALRIAAAVPFL